MRKRVGPVLDVRIRFGNAAMLTPDDAADALIQIVHRLRQMERENLTETPECEYDGTSTVRDLNGQTVGQWSIALVDDEEDADD
jgi:hypothetical protein